MNTGKPKNVAVIVAHPDDEILWCGGTILNHPDWKCFIITLCRRSDTDRAPKFYKVLKILGADGIMGDLDDGPDQFPLSEATVEQTILQLIPAIHFDIIITHDPAGEYSRHRRHEEIGKATIKLWNEKKLSADELWTFAYEDGEGKYFPHPIKSSSLFNILPDEIWETKQKLIIKDYGFDPNSWEAATTPKSESFHQFKTSSDAMRWLTKNNSNESAGTV